MVSQSAIENILREEGRPLDVRSICDHLGIPYNDSTRADVFRKSDSLRKYGIAEKITPGNGRICFTIITIQEGDHE